MTNFIGPRTWREDFIDKKLKTQLFEEVQPKVGDEKSPEIQQAMKSLSYIITGQPADLGYKCTICNDPISGPEDFKDQISVKEFGISGMCQKCQDSVFDCPEEDE